LSTMRSGVTQEEWTRWEAARTRWCSNTANLGLERSLFVEQFAVVHLVHVDEVIDLLQLVLVLLGLLLRTQLFEFVLDRKDLPLHALQR